MANNIEWFDAKREDTVDIEGWIRDCIEGPGGLYDFERYECAVRNDTDEMVAACWVIRCLANPHNEGSAEVLDAIIKRREEVMLDA